MNVSLRNRLFAALLGLLLVAAAGAQDQQQAAPPAPPDFAELQTNWWSYFVGDRAEVEPRVQSFLESIKAQIPALDPQNQQTAQAIFEAVRDNLAVYLNLLNDSELTLQELPPPAVSYSLDDLLRLAANARDARAGADAEQLEVEREQRVFDGASRRRDAAFKDYDAATSSDESWLTALRLVQARSAQAISARRLELLTESYDNAAAYAEATKARVELARERLETTVEQSDLDALLPRVEKSQTAVANAEEKLREAQIAASSLSLDTAEGRSQQRLERERLIGAEIDLAVAEIALAQVEAERWWTALQLDSGADIAALEAQALGWSERARDVRQRIPDWKRETEDELIAVQSISRDGLDRAARRLLDQRLGTAQETLTRIGDLEAAVADLELLSSVVDSAVTQYSGALRSWLASLNRAAKTAYRRVADLADVTLFTVGEKPVTGGDFLRAIIILLIAMLLSRGVRHGIRRVGETDLGGTEASLYTVGRLTHYTIIILAVIVALATIGLDFSSLALVAGALSVGIGFGLQAIVNNFVSGLVILFEHSLRVGDYIELDTGLTGTVKAINVRSTLINTNDNIDIVVPNSEFVTTRLTNWTLGERTLRMRIPFSVAYGSDKELVKKAALEAAAEVQYTLTNMKGREPDIWLVEFGDNGLNFLLLVWVNRQGAKRPTRTRAAYLWALETKFREYDIEIPFPQRDLRLRSGWPPAEQAGAAPVKSGDDERPTDKPT